VVDSVEVDGLVLVGALDGSVTDFEALAAGWPWRDVLDPAWRVVASSVPKAMNWKVLVEQFLEGYHIRSTHRDTFFPLQYDDLNVIEPFGRNVRVTYPYRNIERLRDRPENEWTVRERVTFVYHLFPNTMVATFPDQVSIIVIDPIDVAHSQLTTYTMFRNDRPQGADHDERFSARGRRCDRRAAVRDRRGRRHHHPQPAGQLQRPAPGDDRRPRRRLARRQP
jgi:choline monooxygenase